MFQGWKQQLQRDDEVEPAEMIDMVVVVAVVVVVEDDPAGAAVVVGIFLEL